MTISRAPTARSQVPLARSHSKISPTRENINAQAILSKMIPDRTGQSQSYGNSYGSDSSTSSNMGLNSLGYLQEISDQTSENIEDADNLYQLLPEIEMGTQILIALVLSPRDFVSTDINYGFPTGVLPPQMVTELLKELEDEFSENGYNIKAKLPGILRKAMFEEGSHPFAVIPENSIDDVINGRTRTVVESLQSGQRRDYMRDISKSTGALGSNKLKHSERRGRQGSMTLESLLDSLAANNVPMEIDERVNCDKWGSVKGFVAPMVYDNPTLLKLPRLMAGVQSNRMATALENMGSEVAKLYHEPKYRDAAMMAMPRINEASRETIGHPLVLKLPAESIIPVHVPGEPSNHIGYFVLLDQYGNPIDRATQSDYFKNLTGNLTSESSKLSTMLDNANQNEPDRGMGSTVNTQQALIAYQQVVERDLQTRMLNGAAGANVTISKQMLAYRIMLARSMASMQTRILYLPSDMVTYWAYDYNDNGTGRSFLENNKTLTAARGLLFFANLNAHLRNAVDHRTLDITSDPNDPHPQKTRELVVAEYARNKGSSLPWATGNPKRMMEYVQLSGTNVTMTGVDGYPETKLDITDRDITQSIVDMTYDDELKKRQLMSIGVAPELYDMTTNIEFSSKMVTSNALSTKRAILLQDTTVVHLRDFEMKFCLNSKIMMDKFTTIVGKYAKDLTQELKDKGELYVVLLFLSKFTVSLPKPDVGIEQQLNDYNEYAGAVDSILEAQFSEDLYGEEILGPASSGTVKRIKAMTKATLLRAWCKTNNFMTEALDAFNLQGLDDTGTKMAEEGIDMAKIVSHLTKSIGMQMVALATVNENQWTHIKGEIDKLAIPDANEVPLPDGEGGGGGGYDDYGSGDDEFGGEGGSDDDLFGDLNDDTDNPDDQGNEGGSEDEGGGEGGGFTQAPPP